MSSRIEQIIDELEEYIENCKPKFLSNTDIIVNREEIDDLIRELRMKTPDEIKRYQKIISNKEAILNDAREKAERLIREATIQTNELISEHEIMQQAYAQANEVVTMASKQAQDILDKAIMEANELRLQATQYTEDLLAELENVIVDSIQATSANYSKLLNSLNQYKDVIQSNRQALHPIEEYDEELAIAESIPESDETENS